jgi:predicted phage tail protein
MVTIKLLGELGRRFGRQFQLAVKTPAEAMRALCTQLPEMRQYLLESGEKGVNWRVVTEHPDGLGEDQLLWPLSKRMVVAPQPAGRGATGKIIAGVALVAAAVFLGPIGAPLLYPLRFFWVQLAPRFYTGLRLLLADFLVLRAHQLLDQLARQCFLAA